MGNLLDILISKTLAEFSRSPEKGTHIDSNFFVKSFRYTIGRVYPTVCVDYGLVNSIRSQTIDGVANILLCGYYDTKGHQYDNG